jgi:CubicO group peptidase (beta-lactamase class C family)
MLLVEDGRIDVNENISTYLVDLPSSWKDITVHQLLTHTSGLAHDPDLSETRNNLSIEEIFKLYQKLPLIQEPGAAFHYSNIGYFVLSILIEKISNVSYDSFIKDAIFEKLGMLNTGVDYPNQILKHRAEAYEVKADGVVENADFENMLMKRGAGNLYSTIDDLLKLDRAFSTNILLKEETLNRMISPYTTDTDIGTDVKYGYGLDIVKNDSIYMIFHTGGVLGFKSMFYKYPEKGIVVIACANTNILNRDWRTEFQKLVYNTLSRTG